MLIGDSPVGHNSPADARAPGDSLGRLCEHAGDRIRIGPAAGGIERLEAHLHGQAYSPHRHDTYAIGTTLHGQQTFRFRGEQWHCMPGQCHILHPDRSEEHTSELQSP